MANWNLQLQAARKRAGLSRALLARRARISVESLRSYEMARRHPGRDVLARLLATVGADELSRNLILAGAGYATDAPVPRLREPSISPRDAARIIRARPLPTFLLDARLEILAMSDSAERLIGIPHREGGHPRRSLLTLTTRRAMAARALNWDELVTATIATFKAAVPEEPSVEAPGPYLAQLLKEICGGDPSLVTRFFAIWERTPPFRGRVTGSAYESGWMTSAGAIYFDCLISCLNTELALYAHTWVPADAKSHARLERLTATDPPPAPHPLRPRSQPRRAATTTAG